MFAGSIRVIDDDDDDGDDDDDDRGKLKEMHVCDIGQSDGLRRSTNNNNNNNASRCPGQSCR